MRLVAKPEEFDRFIEAAAVFWPRNIAPPPALHTGESWIVVEAFHQDIRVNIRNLAVANAIRRTVPARLLVVTGTDDHWFSALWTEFDVERMDRLARSYLADDVIDVHRIIDSGGLSGLTVAGRSLPATRTSIDPDDLDRIIDATACRVLMVPRLTAPHRAGSDFAKVRARTRALADAYQSLFSGLHTAALVTSHVDYNHWGLAVEAARRSGVPVIHTQSTGGLKAYAMWPEKARGAPTLRAELTHSIGEFFEKYVLTHRERLSRNADLVAWRSKGNLGRPSWWRGGSSAALELLTAGERRDVRVHAMDRFGFDPEKPVVAVFNHAVSDALGTNVELFDDLAAWFEATAEFAVSHDEANWLFLDHPSQGLYDTTGFFDKVTTRHAAFGHMAFRPSRALSKNVLWSLADLGVTVRGSISNELPAYGIPAIQAGWSEWSACGFSQVASSQDGYWRLLTDTIEGLRCGKPQITDDQIERARLWHWLYRSGADVTSPLIQPWDSGQSNHLLQGLRIAMSQVESDGDPLFASMTRLWERREPMLCRFDFTDGLWERTL